MVDREYIEKNIDIIFEFEKENIKNNKIFHYVQVFKEINVTKKDGSVPPRYPLYPSRMDLQLNPNDNWELEWDTYASLKKLYNKVECLPGSRRVFINSLEVKLSNLNAISTPIKKGSRVYNFITCEPHSNASLA
ncbi:MAG: hypothetical protein E4H06_02750, partial [Methanosarcina sp.]